MKHPFDKVLLTSTVNELSSKPDDDLSPKEIKYFLKIGSLLEYNTYYEEDKWGKSHE